MEMASGGNAFKQPVQLCVVARWSRAKSKLLGRVDIDETADAYRCVSCKINNLAV